MSMYLNIYNIINQMLKQEQKDVFFEADEDLFNAN
jgi:hypothetical protein